MRIEDITNETIKTLIEEAHNGSMTIDSDLEDAISNSNTEEELIANWQSALEGLKKEVEYYWSELEGMKCYPTKDIYIKALKKPEDIIEVHKTFESIFGE